MRLQKISDFFEQQPRAGKILTVLFAFFLGHIDYLTGYQLSFSIFYLIPISIISWYYGRFGLWMVALSIIMWIWADVKAEHQYPNIFYLFWNAGVRVGFFLTVSMLLTKLRFLLEREKKMARMDYVTGINNFQAFMEYAQEEVQRCRRYKRPLTFVYMDCDNFKMVNDSLGHQVGNELLRCIGQTIQGQLRLLDKSCRFGGDEFIILLAETSVEGAKEVTKRVYQALKDAMRQHQWPVSFSIGVAAFNDLPDSVNEMIKRADDLMYSAKKEGKNQIQVGVFSK